MRSRFNSHITFYASLCVFSLLAITLAAFAGAGEDSTRRLLHALGLETTALGWDVAHLSTGERQRLGLARALAVSKNVAGGANVLLLDEPTSGLDETNRALAEKVILEYFASIKKQEIFWE